MASDPQRPKRPDSVVTSLNVAIDALNITKDILGSTPAKAVCGPISVILTMIKARSLYLRQSIRAEPRSGLDDQ